MREYIWRHIEQIVKAENLMKIRGFDPATPWFVTEVAGLQFYDADALNLSDELAHAQGDDIQLVRRPDNPYDENAVEVWCSNGRHQCGHLPREIAADIAPLLDDLKSVNALCTREFNGHAWSMRIMLYGKDIPAKYFAETRRIRIHDAEDWNRTDKEAEKQRAVRREKDDDNQYFQRKIKWNRIDRLTDAAGTFFPDLVNGDPTPLDVVSDGDFVKRKKHKNHRFSFYDRNIPPSLKTRDKWRAEGYRPKKNAEPYAYARIRPVVPTELYHVRDVEPFKNSKWLKEQKSWDTLWDLVRLRRR